MNFEVSPNTPLGHYTDCGPMGLGQYDSPGEYYYPHTTCEVFLVLVFNKGPRRPLSSLLKLYHGLSQSAEGSDEENAQKGCSLPTPHVVRLSARYSGGALFSVDVLGS